MNSSKGIVSLVLGIIGTVIGLFLWPIAGLILGIIAVVLANQDRKIEKNGKNTAGLILGIVSIVASVISWIIAAVVLASLFM